MSIAGRGKFWDQMIESVDAKLVSQREGGFEDDSFDVVILDFTIEFGFRAGSGKDEVGAQVGSAGFGDEGLGLLAGRHFEEEVVSCVGLEVPAWNWREARPLLNAVV